MKLATHPEHAKVVDILKEFAQELQELFDDTTVRVTIKPDFAVRAGQKYDIIAKCETYDVTFVSCYVPSQGWPVGLSCKKHEVEDEDELLDTLVKIIDEQSLKIAGLRAIWMTKKA